MIEGGFGSVVVFPYIGGYMVRLNYHQDGFILEGRD